MKYRNFQETENIKNNYEEDNDFIYMNKNNNYLYNEYERANRDYNIIENQLKKAQK